MVSWVKRVTLWFGKEITVDKVKNKLHELQNKGYSVIPPFYIGYNIDEEIVTNYLKNSIMHSDMLYVIGKKGSILENILKFAEEQNVEIVRIDGGLSE